MIGLTMLVIGALIFLAGHSEGKRDVCTERERDSIERFVNNKGVK